MEEEGYYSTSSRRETETETTTLLLTAASSSSTTFSYYNPCYCLEVAIRSFLKCLGLGRSSSKEYEQDQEEVELEKEEEKSCTQDVDVDPTSPPTSTDETGKQDTEDAGVTNVVGRGIRSKIRFPTRPRIRPGRPVETTSKAQFKCLLVVMFVSFIALILVFLYGRRLMV